MKVTISYSNHITENFKSVKVPFLKIADLVKSSFNYSAGIFKDGYRKRDNYLNYCDLIILDIDDGLSIQDAKNLFCAFDYIIATTKSHQKEKNGKVCDRFRVILPTETPITLNEYDYTKLMAEIHNEYNFVDKACKDASRFYYPAKECITFVHNGFCNFDWEYYWDKIKPDPEVEESIKHFRDNFIGYKKIQEQRELKFEYGREKIDYIRSILNTEKLLELLKFDAKFVSGQRNTTLYSYVRYLEDIGLEREEIRGAVTWINNQGDSINQEELEKTVFKRLR